MNFDKSDFEAVSVPPFRRKTDLHQKREKKDQNCEIEWFDTTHKKNTKSSD